MIKTDYTTIRVHLYREVDGGYEDRVWEGNLERLLSTDDAGCSGYASMYAEIEEATEENMYWLIDKTEVILPDYKEEKFKSTVSEVSSIAEYLGTNSSELVSEIIPLLEKVRSASFEEGFKFGQESKT